MNLRPWRPDDCRILYNWRTDPTTSRWCFTDQQFDFADHEKWFSAFMSDPGRLGYMLENGGEPVAQIRFDPAEMPGSRRVSLGVAPQMHGKGYGTAVLRQAIDQPELSADTILLVAETLDDNIASQKLFNRSGFINAGSAKRQGRNCQCWLMTIGRAQGPVPLRLFCDKDTTAFEKMLNLTGLGLLVEKDSDLCIFLDASADYDYEGSAAFRLRPEPEAWLLDVILNFNYSFELPLEFDNDLVAVAQIVAAVATNHGGNK